MYDFKNVDSKIYLTSGWILERIDQAAIWCYYWGNFKLHTAYSSKFRKDRNPSTSFYVNKNGIIKLHDFKENVKHDCFSFVMQLYGLTFKDTLYKIASDFGLLNNTRKVSDSIIKYEVDLTEKAPILIQFEPEAWNLKNLKYWNDYELHQETLEKEDVYAVKNLYINKFVKKLDVSFDTYAYLIKYVVEDELVEKTKIYTPKGPRKTKWISSVPLNVVGDVYNLPFKDDRVFICKSKKDKMIFSQFFTDVCWTQNETEGSFPDEMQDFLKSKYEKCYIVWGSDKQGVEACTKLNKKGFLYFNVPNKHLHLGINDPAEYQKLFGKYLFKELLKEKKLL
jgi:hypothetical protein